MRPSSAKAKGRKLQQVVRDVILRFFPSLTDKDVKSTTMGESGIDVQLSEAARKLFPWATECKNYGKITIYAWWEQATLAADKEGLQPLLVVKANHKEPLACIRLEDFMTLTKGAADGPLQHRPVHGYERNQDASGSTGETDQGRPSQGANGEIGEAVPSGDRGRHCRSSFEVLP